MPIDLQFSGTDVIALVKRYLEDLQQGKITTLGKFDLTTGVTTTVVNRLGMSSNSVVCTQAWSANASNADIVRIVPAKDSFTVTHTNSALARTHRYAFFTGLST